MKHVNVALFVPDEGCPHRCAFCNQRTISGSSARLSAGDVKKAAETALKGRFDTTGGEIAFFGGSFTGIERGYMDELLAAAYEYVEKGFFKGIRVSTRPDYISDEILVHLKKYGVSAVELGCQSMVDSVLEANLRGHTSAETEDACRLVRFHGFELGVQMMTGLYTDTDEGAFYTAKRLIALSPDTVRIYPTVVLEGTLLAELYRKGLYVPQSLEDAVSLCAELVKAFEKAGVRVIRLGLHSGGGVEEGRIAGAYHPAFAELCRSRILLEELRDELEKAVLPGKTATIRVNPRLLSQLVGQKKSNLKALESEGYKLRIETDEELEGRPFYIVSNQ